MKVFFDGGCRPAGMETAVVIAGESFVEQGLGPGSAMEAEWLALLAAMRLVEARGLVDAVLLGDGVAVIAQAKGEVRCPPAFAHHLAVFRRWAPRRLRYVKRSQNLAGIALAKLHPR